MEPHVMPQNSERKSAKHQKRDLTQLPVTKVVKSALGMFRKARVMLDTADLNGINAMERMFARDDLDFVAREHDALGKVLTKVRKALEMP